MDTHFSGKSPSTLSDNHLRAIGAVVSNWSMLEMAMEITILGLYEIKPDRGLVLTNNISFTNKITILRILALRGAIKDAADIKAFTNLIDKIEKTSPLRNQVAHGLWSGTKNPAIAERHLISVRGKRLRTKKEKVPLSEIEAISNDILALWKELREADVRLGVFQPQPAEEQQTEQP